MTDTTELAPVTTEPAYGAASLERDQGYVPMPDESKEESPAELTKDEAAERLKQDGSGEQKMIFAHVTNLPANVTLTLDQAATMVAESREADAAQAELDGTKAAQKEVDALRNPHGVEPKQPHDDTEIDVERALKSPKIAKAIADRVTEAETQRTRYETAVQHIGNERIAAINADFPELMNVPLNQWVPAIKEMHTREPARAAAIVNRLKSLAQVETAVLQIAEQKAAREKAEFAQYSDKENARFRELTKGIPAKEMSAIAAHIPTMLAESGVNDPRAFLQAIHGQSTFPRASAEMLLIKAAKYDLMQKAAKAVPARGAVPSVMRPGASGPRTNSRDSGLAALSAQLSKSGNLKDAAKLLAARRSKGR